MKKMLFKTLCSGVIASLALTACSKPESDASASSKTDASASTEKSLKPFHFLTNWYAEAEHGGYYQAKAKDFYKDAGLDVTIQMGGPQVNNYQLLGAKKADCAIGADIATLNAISQGVGVTTVATAFQKELIVLIAHDDVSKIEQLKDKTLLIDSVSMSSWYPWFKAKYGLDDATVKPYTFNIQPFMVNKDYVQQGYFSSEPYALEQAGAKFKVFFLSDYDYPSYGNAVVCRTDVIQERPEEVKAFLAATMKGWKSYLEDSKAGDALIFKDNPQMTQGQIDYAIDKIKQHQFVTGGDAATMGIGIITPERMKVIHQMSVDLGLIDAAKATLEKFYDDRFIKEIKEMP